MSEFILDLNSLLSFPFSPSGALMVGGDRLEMEVAARAKVKLGSK